MKRNKKAILLSFITTLSLIGYSPKIIKKIDENREVIDVSSTEIHKNTNNKLNREIIVVTPYEVKDENKAKPTETPTINQINSFKPVYAFAYVKENSPIYNSYKEDKTEVSYVNMYQKVLVETSNDHFYSVKTEDGITGYMNISSLELLPENYVEVDLSDQTVRVVDDYEEVLNCYVVTGAPGNDTNEGYTEILDKTYDRPLVGPTWNVDVNYFFPFNYSEEGFHDASWRDSFGGNIYTYNGSHGCVNMRRSDVEIMDEHVEVGTKVLVHK